ncbi:MAG TPA: PKD domain-containing protein, partial [Thermoanaerobaculia bacterium]
MNRFRVYGVTSVLTLLAAIANATTIVVPTDEQLVDKTPLIVRATVVSSTPIERGRAIWTETILRVDETIKGNAPAVVTVREPGGILGDRITMIYGSPEYVAGERVLAFLTPTPRNDYQTVDMFIGRFEEARGTDGRKLWIRSAIEHGVDLLASDMNPMPESKLNRDAGRFEQFIDDRAAGRPHDADYFVATPKQNTLRTSADFTLIDEPTVYRWFAFDSGASVSWRSSGTQPGYNGGGVNEVRTAMSSWTNYTAARILFSYDGTFSTTPGGLDRANGINEVLLNDPLSEISGSFNPSTGGVVGRGGFNGVSSRRSWTAPFAADASHTNTTYNAWNITEGNLVIQDGVSPSAGMSSNRLAEILAHEFGHTLGFGHSADASALMYATVGGIGPQLREDDRTAARWLYPGSGTGNPPPGPSSPNAPSNLSASVNGTSAVLSWSDNSSNEDAFRIYYAGPSGNFSAVGEAGADQRGVTVTNLSDGTWRFYITAYNGGGESSPSNTATITISTTPVVPLVASFSFSPSAPVADQPISFSDTSTGGVTSRFWNFGDTTNSTQATPVKRYMAPGTYTVTLTVFRGSESRVASQSITVGAQSPILPPVDAYRSLVPVSGQSEGVGGSVWRTELALFNAGSEGVNASLIFVPGAGGAVQTR